MPNNDFETVKNQSSLKEYAEAKLERRRRAYICPVCKSGTGKNGTAAFSIEPKGERWKCFACGQGGDVFDLAGIVTGDTDKRRELEEVARFFNLPLEGKPASASKPDTLIKRSLKKEPQPEQTRTPGIEAAREYVKACAEAMPGSEGEAYMTERGFTPLEVQGFGIGYDAQRKRVVIPWPGDESYYHVDRDITGNHAHKYEKPKSAEVGTQPVFNRAALKSENLFIVEGALDAYALIALGFEAVALCSTASRATVDALQGSGYGGMAIVLLDADGAGLDAAEVLTEELAALGINAYNATRVFMGRFLGKKDAAEVLTEERERLKDFLLQVQSEAQAQRAQAEEERYKAALSSMRAVNPFDTVMDIWNRVNFVDPVPTGIECIDEALGGGLVQGLTVLGAISSMGKTTLCGQIADNIAAMRQPVLFATIEQSAQELVANSLARYMRNIGGVPDGVVPALAIRSNKERDKWGDYRNSLFLEACNEYSRAVSPYLCLMEGTERPGVSDIRAVAETMKARYGVAPVVFVDYLQLLKAQDERDTDKITADKNMTSLRQLARDMRTPVVVISSLNRSSYSGSIEMDSFKESGGIEYGSDVLLGLQPLGMDDELDETSETKKKSKANKIMRKNKTSDSRLCELKVLKNRFGKLPAESPALEFIPVSSIFTERKRKRADSIL